MVIYLDRCETFKMKLFLLILLVSGVLGEGGEKCDDQQLKNMRKTFSDCSWRYLEEYGDARNTFTGEDYLQTATCFLLTNTVEKCGEVWQDCHSPRDVNRMRHLQLQSLMDRYRQEVDIEHCKVVSKYRKVGREGLQECDDSQTLASQNRFQECSHQSSTKTYNSIRGLLDVSLITEKLCSTLQEIGTRCVENLNFCFSEEDVKQLKNGHMEIMKKFLIRISKEKVASNGLDHCDALENMDREDDSVVVKVMGGDIIENNDRRTVYTKIDTTHPVVKESKVTELSKGVTESIKETDSFIWNFVEDSDTSKSYSGNLDDGKMIPLLSPVSSSLSSSSPPSPSSLEVEELSRLSSSSGSSTSASILVIVMSLAFVSITLGLVVQASFGTCVKYYRPQEGTRGI